MIIPVGRIAVAKAEQPEWRMVDILWVYHVSPGRYLIFNGDDSPDFQPPGLRIMNGKCDQVWGDAYYTLLDEASSG